MADGSDNRLLSTAEVAERLGMTEGGLRYWRHERKGPPSFKVGRQTKYVAADVEAWLTDQKQKTTVGDKLPEPEAGAA